MIGILGGSGLYDLDGLVDIEEKWIETAFGEPSDAYICGRLDGEKVCFLPRHGRGHRIMPSEINHRANIMGFKILGVEAVVSVSAVGSLKDEYRPEDIVLPDQYFDRTKNSEGHSFFGKGIVAHVPFGVPTCSALAEVIEKAIKACISELGAEVRVCRGGTYVNMEGPAFSTRAESEFYRHFGYDVVGMTSLAEAKLCREAEICYQSMAMVTDYDCWHETEEMVSVETVIGHLMANTAFSKHVVKALIGAKARFDTCRCQSALRNAIMTSPDCIPEERKRALAPITERYIGLA